MLHHLTGRKLILFLHTRWAILHWVLHLIHDMHPHLFQVRATAHRHILLGHPASSSHIYGTVVIQQQASLLLLLHSRYRDVDINHMAPREWCWSNDAWIFDLKGKTLPTSLPAMSLVGIWRGFQLLRMGYHCILLTNFFFFSAFAWYWVSCCPYLNFLVRCLVGFMLMSFTLIDWIVCVLYIGSDPLLYMGHVYHDDPDHIYCGCIFCD